MPVAGARSDRRARLPRLVGSQFVTERGVRIGTAADIEAAGPREPAEGACQSTSTSRRGTDMMEDRMVFARDLIGPSAAARTVASI